VSGALDRLLASATGHHVGHLRPRQRSLFEPGPTDSAVSEVWAERWAAPAGAEHREPDRPPPPAEAESAGGSTPVHADAPARAVPPEQPFPSIQASSKPTAPEPRAAKAATASKAAELPSRATPFYAVPPPTRTAPATGTRKTNRAVAGDPRPRRAMHAGTAAPPADEVSARAPRIEPPPALAPEAPSGRQPPPAKPAEPLFSDPRSARTNPAPAMPPVRRPQPAQATAEPEIHIHIGRLEVRTPPAAPAPRPVRPERPRPKRSLSDYLRERGT
jgi:hypothetical protein